MAKNLTRLFKPRFQCQIKHLTSSSTTALNDSSSSAPPPRWRGVSRQNPDRVYRRLSAVGAGGKTVESVLNEYIMEGNAVRKDELCRSARELRKYGRYDYALQIFDWMEKRKISLSHTDHAMRLDLIGKDKGINEAEKYFNGLPPAAKNRLTYGSLLNCYCNELLSNKAFELFDEMDKRQFIDCSLPFNNLMTLHMRLGQPEEVPAIVEKMKRRNISLCTYSYNIWMQSCGALNDMAGVESVLDQILKDGEKGNSWTTYSNLATIYINAGLHEKAESALKQVETKIGPRDREAYHYLITLYAGINNLGEVNRVWALLKTRFPITPNLSYLMMLQALTNLKDVDGVTKCFKEWESGYSTYDPRLPTVAIRAYLDHDMHEEAESMFDHASQKSKVPLFKARELFMVFFLKNRQLDLALSHLKAAFSESGEIEWKPFPETLINFLKYFEEAKDVENAEKFFKILKHVNYIDSDVYTWLLKVYVAAGRSAPDMYQRLKEDGIEISEELGNLLESVCPEKD